MNKPKILYHCLRHDPRGDAIQATCERTINDRSGKFLFATNRLTKALAFAFFSEENEGIFNAGIEGTQNELILLCGGQNTLDKPRNIKVYSFENNEFEQSADPCQWVSEKPIPFGKTNLILETHNINTLMDKGLQIFLMNESHEELTSQNFVDNEIYGTNDHLDALCNHNKIRWINQERGINPCPTLLSKLNPQTPHPSPKESTQDYAP